MRYRICLHTTSHPSSIVSIWRPWRQNLPVCWLKRTQWTILVIYLYHEIHDNIHDYITFTLYRTMMFLPHLQQSLGWRDSTSNMAASCYKNIFIYTFKFRFRIIFPTLLLKKPMCLSPSLFISLSLSPSLVNVLWWLTLNPGNGWRAGLSEVQKGTTNINAHNACEGLGSCQESPWKWEGYVGSGLVYSWTGPSCIRVSIKNSNSISIYKRSTIALPEWVSIFSSSFGTSIYQFKWNPDCLFPKSISISPNLVPAQEAAPAGETGSTTEDVDRDGFGLGLGWPNEVIIPSSNMLYFLGKLTSRTIVIRSTLGKSLFCFIWRFDPNITSLNHCLLAYVKNMHHIEASWNTYIICMHL